MYAELGSAVCATPFWRFEAGNAYLNAAALAEADAGLHGATWLGSIRPPAPAGLRGRLQAGGIVRRANARLAVAGGEAAGLQGRLARWWAWVQGLKWTQADLLQVMEELEPHAVAALHTYFLARTALQTSRAAFEQQLAERLPSFPADLAAGLTLGAAGLPSIETAETVLAIARQPASDPERLGALARSGHRGPGEIRPDAARWHAAPALLDQLADLGPVRWTRIAAAQQRQRSLVAAEKSLTDGQFRDLQTAVEALGAAMRAVDVAWDALTLVMAAAQRWVTAAGRETLAAGLVSRPADVLYLELEELKQVATGEWHAGDREAVQAAVAARMAAARTPAAPRAPDPIPHTVSPGACDGPRYGGSPAETPPPAGAVWLAETADPGCTPLWAFAACIETTGADPWTPGLIAARSLGVPAQAGVRPLDAGENTH